MPTNLDHVPAIRSGGETYLEIQPRSLDTDSIKTTVLLCGIGLGVSLFLVFAGVTLTADWF